MIQVRQGVFETNSSSTHSLSICSTDAFNKWKEGELYYNMWVDENEYMFVDEAGKDKAIKDAYQMNANSYDSYDEFLDELDDWWDDYELPLTFDQYKHRCYDWYGDYYSQEYVTEHGDSITCFGYYGYM